ncbi:MAG: bifunctional [glutamine synthetase] adenylyltransferase/[glutamine synthetase]-adenylyl-L-tyrosine phosphorylase [Candidatus Puniceispirillales bacterium]
MTNASTMIQPVITSPRQQDTVIAEACRISAHIDRLCRDYGSDLEMILNGKAGTIITAAEKDLTAHLEKLSQDDEIKAAVRRFRMRVNHAVVITDLLGLETTETHLDWLSRAARAAVDGVARWLTTENSRSGLESGWFILAMGKLGADELNYSSDIDLIIITLPEAEDNHQDYIRLTRRLTNILSQPTADGIGWRVDLRLRPDPGATPIAINRDAAISYYESLARTWERAAFIRATPVAGNIEEGHAFLNEIKPFLWRRYLDFTVLEDMRVMLRREKRPPDLLGFNIKNGEGGIRSIEFFTHVQQLIAAGRETGLRQRQTRDALAALAAANWIADDDSKALAEAYLHWRRLEHRLQMIGDAQTHQMPKSEEQIETLARFCGHDDTATFRQAIIALSDEVSRRTASLMARIGGSSDDNIISGWLERQDEDTETLIEHLAALGYRNADSMVPVMQGWIAGRIPATRSERSRQVMIRLLPKLLSQFAESDQPDTSFNQFSRLMDALPSGLQLLSLLDSNTDLARTITGVIASAPEVGEEMARHPILVDSLVYGEFWQPVTDWQAREERLARALDDAPDYEEQLNILRRSSREWKFQIALHLLTGTIDSPAAGLAYTRIAEILIRVIIPHVETHLAERYGRVDDGGLVVLGLGRLGAEAMTARSDLDLIFIYDADAASVSDGKRSLAASVWYARLGQQLINALTAHTGEGRCYSVDMRLRPSGNAGPVAVHIDGFEKYQHQEAWLWEHMALIKARPIGGVRHAGLETRVRSIISSVIRQPRDTKTILREVATMRDKIRKHFPASGSLDLRHRDGGLMDVDFLIQALQLMPEAAALPLCHNPLEAIPHLQEAGLLEKTVAAEISRSAEQLNALQQWVRLTTPEDRNMPNDEAEQSRASLKPLQEHFGIASTAELTGFVDALARPVAEALNSLLDGAATTAE